MFAEFGVPDTEALDAELRKDKQDQGGNGTFFYLKNGTTLVRVLPPFKDRGYWYKEVEEHTFPTGDEIFNAICLRPYDEVCPICEEYERLSDAKQIEVAKKLRAAKRYYFSALIFAAPGEYEKGKVYIIKAPKAVKTGLLEWDRDLQGLFDITGALHAADGKGFLGVNMRIERTGQLLKTRYTVKNLGSREDLAQRLEAEGISSANLKIPDLDSIVDSSKTDASVMAKAALKYTKHNKAGTSSAPTVPLQSLESLTTQLPSAQGALSAPVLGLFDPPEFKGGTNA